MSQPLIYSKISEVMNRIGSIGKDQRNDAQSYQFRGIDDVYNALHQPLADAKIFYVPEVLDQSHDIFEHQDGSRVKRSIRVRLRVKYTFFAEDGSSISTVVEGEAIDSSDKATNKAMSAALKYMLIQVFCIPTLAGDDADRSSPEIGTVTPKSSYQESQALIRNKAKRAQAQPKPPEPIKLAPSPGPVEPFPVRQGPITVTLPAIPGEAPFEDFENEPGSYVFTFGKYKGARMSNVPVHDLNGYVQWIKSKNGTFEGRLRAEMPVVIKLIEEFLDTRDVSKR